MKKIVLVSLFLSLFSSFNAYSANIEEITPANNWEVDIILSDDINLPKENLESDIKILKDLIVSMAYKDTSDAKKVILNLNHNLNKNTTYSLLWVVGSDVNIDFEIKDEIPTEIVLKNDKVLKINIVDDKTLEIFYKKDLEWEEFVYKVLRDLWTKEIKLKSWYLSVFVENPLETFSSYILLVNSFKDADSKEVKFDEVFHEFVTPENLEEFIIPEVVKEKTEVKAPVKDEWNLEKVAMNSAKVPTTWTATWIILLIAWIITWFFFVKFRKK